MAAISQQFYGSCRAASAFGRLTLSGTGLALLLFSAVVHAEGDDTSEEERASFPLSGRQVTKMPTSISHRMESNGLYSYRISGIYTASKENADAGDAHCKLQIPACKSAEVDRVAGTCLILTTRELTLSEFADTIDRLAKRGGGFPYWSELEARDLPISELARGFSYSIEPFSGSIPDHLAWFGIPREEPFKIPLVIAGPSGGFFITPSTAYCMCHSRFALRILDAEGKVVWKNDSTVAGALTVALAAGPNGHQVFIKQYDHGDERCFLVRQKVLVQKTEPGSVGTPQAE